MSEGPQLVPSPGKTVQGSRAKLRDTTSRVRIGSAPLVTRKREKRRKVIFFAFIDA